MKNGEEILSAIAFREYARDTDMFGALKSFIEK